MGRPQSDKPYSIRSLEPPRNTSYPPQPYTDAAHNHKPIRDLIEGAILIIKLALKAEQGRKVNKNDGRSSHIA